MKVSYSILLIPSILSLYSSMSCMLVPGFLNAKLTDQTGQKTSIHRADHKVDQQLLSNVYQLTPSHSKEIPRKEKQSTDHDFDHYYVSNQIGKYADRPDLSSEPALPLYTRGIYLSNFTAHSKEKILSFIRKAYQYNLNTFVIDVQSHMVSREIVDMIKGAGIFPVARVVVAEGGLKQRNFSESYTQKILKLISDSAAQGFKEIQLDYIRYADIENLLSLSLSHKYGVIRSLLKRAYQEARKNSVYLSADLFGRVTLNQHDQIGQRLELFAEYTQTIYPMLYPSHYTNDISRISKPYHTVKEGLEKSKSRLANTRVVAYIQGFNMKVKHSGLSMVDYIKAQIKACRDASSDGWIIWNPRNQYSPSFEAIKRYTRDVEQQLKRQQ